MRKKRDLCIISAIFALSLMGACCLTGCGKPKPPETENSVVYVPSYSNITQRTEYNEDRSGTASSGMNTGPNIFSYNFIRNNKLYSISRIFTRQAGLGDYLAVYDMDAGQNLVDERKLGCIGSYFEYNGGLIRYYDWTLEVYNDAFEKIKEVDLKNAYDFMRELGRELSCDDVVVDGEGRIGIVNRDMLLILDGDGKLLCSIECPLGTTAFMQLVVTRSGDWYVFCENSESDAELYCVDVEKRELAGALDILPVKRYHFIEAGEYGEENLYIYTKNYIYEYDTEASECKELFCLRDYGLTVDDKSSQGILDSGEFYILNEQDSRRDDSDWLTQFELATVKAVPEDEVHPRKELVMAAISEMFYFYREPVMNFNKYNKDYYITIKDYTKDARDREGTVSAIQLFYNDLITGNGADIFWVDNSKVDIENLGKKDVAVDLYELIDADEELSREDFIPNILSAMDYDGKLYAISPDFYLKTLVGKASIVGQYDKWDFDALYDLHMQYPDAELISPSEQDWTLNNFLKYSMDVFYDKKSGKCNFDSEQFSKMLEIVAAQPTNIDYGVPMQKLIKEDEAILYREDALCNCDDIKWIDKYFEGNEIEYVGYPSNEQSCAVVCFDYLLVINSQSGDKEGAWEFVKGFFTDESCLSSINRFPIMQGYFDSILEQEKAECRYGSMEDVYGTRIRGEALTEEQAQTLCYLVNSATAVNEYDIEVYNIIYEEVQGCLAGQRSAGEAAAVIQDRVQVYLDEQN